MKDATVLSSKTLAGVGISVGIITLFGVLAQILVRNLFRFLTFSPDFEAVFRQISTPETETTAPWVLLVLLVLPAVFGISALWKKGRRGRGLSLLSGVVAVFVWGGAGVLFTKVNGILVYDVVRILLPLLQEGVL